jgi:pilus assembly protein CpaE
MAMLGVVGAKGGCGTSLVAANLAVAFSRRERSLLVDLNPMRGCDDLLLNMRPSRSWLDLLPVADELTSTHLSKALDSTQSRLQLLAAPPELVGVELYPRIAELVTSLQVFSPWVTVDLPSGDPALSLLTAARCDALLIVSTADAPALRACRRLLEALPAEQHSGTYLALNQIRRGHPADPRTLASSLGLPIVGALPPDMRSVGKQVAFGFPAALDKGSAFGRAVRAMAERIAQVAREGTREGVRPPPAFQDVVEGGSEEEAEG